MTEAVSSARSEVMPPLSDEPSSGSIQTESQVLSSAVARSVVVLRVKRKVMEDGPASLFVSSNGPKKVKSVVAALAGISLEQTPSKGTKTLNVKVN